MEKAKKRWRFPIVAKSAILFFVFSFVLTEVAMIYFSITSANRNEANVKIAASSISASVAKTVDVDRLEQLKIAVKSIVDASPEKPYSDEWGSERWNAYIAQFDSFQENANFNYLRDYLRGLVEANAGLQVDCLYFSYVDVSGPYFVYLVDSAPVDDACPPGCIDPVYDVGFPPYITNTAEYGWLATAGTPVYKNGQVIGYAMCDISMTVVRASQRDGIIWMFVFLVSAVLLIFVLCTLFIYWIFIKPVRKLNRVASTYDLGDSEKVHQSFKEITINTHDELQDLCESMKKMEDDVYNKIAELTAKNEELKASQQETAKMTELANKDGLTGVRNKVAYDSESARIDEAIAMRTQVPFAIAMIDLNDLKIINDEYGHHDGDVALVKLSNIICAIFAHSPVYRVGGDEFVVILRYIDYQRNEKLKAEFVAKIAELSTDDYLSPAEKTSAAIGVAVYDPGIDKCVADVFNRADGEMYEMKRQMKAKKE